MFLWITIFSFLLVVLIPLHLLGRIAKDRVEEVKSRFSENEIILATSQANFFGKRSLGSKQLRGNGCLVLTRDVLYFIMMIPRREIIVSLQAITGCEITFWHIGKSKRRSLLKVNYKNEKGDIDSGAWLISDPEKWKDAIEELIKRTESFDG